MSPSDADGMANSVDPDQTAPLEAVWSGSALFAQAYLSESLGSVQYSDLPDFTVYAAIQGVSGRLKIHVAKEKEKWQFW